jgi:hypothetical protein
MTDEGFSVKHGARPADPQITRIGIVITDGTVRSKTVIMYLF